MKYKFFEGTVPRSGVKVYHLSGEVSAKVLGRFTDKEFYFSEVFSSLKKAESAGRKLLKEKLRLVHKKYYKDRFDKFSEFYDFCQINLGKYSFNDEVCGGFTIMEFDPLFRENYDQYESEYPKRDDKSLYACCKEIEYEYNILGVLTMRLVDGTLRFPEDDLPDAGSKFQNGDFVTTKNDHHKQVYVVSGSWRTEYLEKLRKDPYWENNIWIDYIEDNGTYYYDYSIFNEALLRRYDGEVNESMLIASKICKGEIDISKELGLKIELGEIDCSPRPSLKEAIANDKISSPEESMHYKG